MIAALLGNWRLILAAVALVGAFVAGIRVEADHRDAQDLVVERANAKAYAFAVGQGRNSANALLKDLAKRDKDNEDLKRRLANVPTKYVPIAVNGLDLPPEPVPGWVITDYDVRLWNAALCQGLEGYSACRGATAPEPTDVARGTFLTKDEVMANLLDNAKSCNGDRLRLGRLVGLIKGP